MKQPLHKDEEEEEKGSFSNPTGPSEFRPDSPDARPLDQPDSDVAYDPSDQDNGAEGPPIPLYQPVGRHKVRRSQSSDSSATSPQIEPLLSSPPRVHRAQSSDSSATSPQPESSLSSPHQVHSLPKLPIVPPESSDSSETSAHSLSSPHQVHSLPELPIEPPQSSDSSATSAQPECLLSSTHQVHSLPWLPIELPQSSDSSRSSAQPEAFLSSTHPVYSLPWPPIEPTQSSDSSETSAQPEVSQSSSHQVHSLPPLPIEPPQSSDSNRSSIVIDSLLSSPRHPMVHSQSTPASPSSPKLFVVRGWFSTSSLNTSYRSHAKKPNTTPDTIQIRFNSLGQPVPVYYNADGAPIAIHTVAYQGSIYPIYISGDSTQSTTPETPVQSNTPEVLVRSAAPEIPVQPAPEVPVQYRELEVAIPIDNRSPQDILREKRDSNFVQPEPFSIAFGLYEGTFFLAPGFPVPRRPHIPTPSPPVEVFEFDNGSSDEYEFGDEGPSVRGMLLARRRRRQQQDRRSLIPLLLFIPAAVMIVGSVIALERVFWIAEDRNRDDDE
ncbi:hypothetical protein HA402_005922 [Bradysia odoriphaga]|nr:hypothetical protein HA402_005922 [Bradysia odoriphaga]